MNQSRLELKVGVFIFFCLALVAGLLIQFSKGTTLFHKTYQLRLVSSTAGGLKRQAGVQMSGVQVGYVSDVKLAPEGTNVNIFVTIYNEYAIKEDASFKIEQSGFLGDQYVAIYPGKHQGNQLAPNAMVLVDAPFNLLEVARSAAGFIRDVDVAATNLNDAINDVRRLVLNEKTLTNFAATIDTLQRVSENAGLVVADLKGFVDSNSAPTGLAISNLLVFSQRLNDFVNSAQLLIDTNRPQIADTISNLQTFTVMLTNFLNDAHTSRGVVGNLLNNEQMAANMTGLVSNLNAYSGYLRSNSLWHVVFRAPPELSPTTNQPSRKPK